MEPAHAYVSRGGQKLRHALDTFGLDPAGMRCADFGASTGGFTDCLLQAGASHVTTLDTAYGTLAWKLRTDARVSVLERTSALHAPPPPDEHKPELIVIDMGWTPQRLCIPAALRWLAHTSRARIVCLIKPHYELDESERRSLLKRGVLDAIDAERITRRVADLMPTLGVQVLGLTRSPILGGASRGRKEGNSEYLCLLARADALAEPGTALTQSPEPSPFPQHSPGRTDPIPP